MRAEGVEPPWAEARRLLRPVRLPRSATPARCLAAPLAKSAIGCMAGPPGLEPGPTRLELAVLPLTPRAYRSGRPVSNGPLRGGAPVLFHLSYVREKYARLESNQRPLLSQSSALSTELQA